MRKRRHEVEWMGGRHENTKNFGLKLLATGLHVPVGGRRALLVLPGRLRALRRYGAHVHLLVVVQLGVLQLLVASWERKKVRIWTPGTLRAYSLARFSMVVPHQMDQPQPTRQKMMVKACDTPTMRLMIKAPMRPRTRSCWEKRGMPRHRQKKPENIVPAGEGRKDQL